MSIDFNAATLSGNHFTPMAEAGDLNVSSHNAAFILEGLGIEFDYCGSIDLADAFARIAAANELANKRPDEVTSARRDPASAALVDALRGAGATMGGGTTQDASRLMAYMGRLYMVLKIGESLGATHMTWA